MNLIFNEGARTVAVRFAFILGVGLGITPHAGAQQAITGRVSNEGSGRPLSEVSLRFDGEQVAFTTNANGTLTIPDMAAGDRTLTVSLIGLCGRGRADARERTARTDGRMGRPADGGVAGSGPLVEDQSDFQLATLGASRAVGVVVNTRAGGS